MPCYSMEPSDRLRTRAKPKLTAVRRPRGVNRVKVFLFAAVAAGVLCGCASGTTSSIPTVQGALRPQAQANSAGRLSPVDRSPLSAAEQNRLLAGVPASEARLLRPYIGRNSLSRSAIRSNPEAQNVTIVIDKDGVYHTNDPGLRTALAGVRFPIETARASATRRPQTYGYDPGTGPYRRVFTAFPQSAFYDPNNFGNFNDPNPSFVQATAQLNCNQGAPTVHTLNGNPYGQDSGHVYVGGRPYDGGAEVDAGVQYNRFVGSDNYTPFLRVSTIGYDYNVFDSLNGAFVTGNYHMGCGNQTTLTFGVEPSNSIPFTPTFPNVELFMLFTDAGHNYELYIDPQSPIFYGFDVNCNQCIFKRMTSIAQSHAQNVPDDLADGYSFHATWLSTVVSCRMANPTVVCASDYLNAQGLYPIVSVSCSEYPSWAAFSNSDCYGSPANAAVAVQYYGPGSEDDLINLATPAPSSTGSPRCAGCGGLRRTL
jgi:hypothetical protein